MSNKPNPKAGQQQLEQDLANAAAKQKAAEVAESAAKASAVETTPEENKEPVESQSDIIIPPVAAVTKVAEPAPVLEVVPADSDVTINAAVVVESPEPVQTKGALKDQLAVILKNVPAAFQVDINRIFMYLDAMAPGRPISIQAGAKEQVALYKSIQGIINRQTQYFTPLYSALLTIFKAEAKGALGDRYRLRFLESIALGERDRKAFQYLTHLLFATAEPGSRKNVINSIDLGRALENGLTAEGRDRVLAYYDV